VVALTTDAPACGLLTLCKAEAARPQRDLFASANVCKRSQSTVPSQSCALPHARSRVV